MTRVEPAAALVGDIAVPAVKGICQRGALLAAIADGESELRNFGHAADTDAALAAVRALGAEVREPESGTVRIAGRGLRGLAPPADRPWGERIAYVQDPDGYPILVIQQPSPTSS